MMLNTPTFANKFDSFGYFYILTYQVLKLKQNTKHTRSVCFMH